MLGHDCSLQRLEADLNDVASEKNLRLQDVHCQVTREQCNQQCESPPGQRLICSGNVLR